MGPLERTIQLGVKLHAASDEYTTSTMDGDGMQDTSKSRRGQRLTVHLGQGRPEEEPAAKFNIPVLRREWNTVELAVCTSCVYWHGWGIIVLLGTKL